MGKWDDYDASESLLAGAEAPEGVHPEKLRRIERRIAGQARYDRERSAKRRCDPAYLLQKRAHRLVEAALATGKLVRGPCEDCGSTFRVEAHHNDYSRQLDVVWYCKHCHDKRTQAKRRHFGRGCSRRARRYREKRGRT